MVCAVRPEPRAAFAVHDLEWRVPSAGAGFDAGPLVRQHYRGDRFRPFAAYWPECADGDDPATHRPASPWLPRSVLRRPVVAWRNNPDARTDHRPAVGGMVA